MGRNMFLLQELCGDVIHQLKCLYEKPFKMSCF